MNIEIGAIGITDEKFRELLKELVDDIFNRVESESNIL